MIQLPGKEKDFLTDCYAKEFLMPMLQQLKRESDDSGKPFSILVIDLDHFKAYNDKYGHMYGDELLKFFSSSLRLMVTGKGESIFRFGGDEFIATLPGVSSKEAYARAIQIENILKARPCIVETHLFKLSFSAGICTYPRDGKTLKEILEKADKAMYISKKYGRGRVTRFDRIWLAVTRNTLALPVLVLLVIILLYLGKDILSSVKGFYENYEIVIHEKSPAPEIEKAPEKKTEAPPAAPSPILQPSIPKPAPLPSQNLPPSPPKPAPSPSPTGKLM